MDLRVPRRHDQEMNGRTSLLVAALVLAACAPVDRYRASALQPGADPRHWTFTANAPPAYPANSATAERTRMGWLRAWMDEAGACPGAWKVTGRRVFPRRIVFGAATDRVVYDVECLGSARTAPSGRALGRTTAETAEPR
jgi:hypothetical protein